jgi:hypothetical protein
LGVLLDVDSTDPECRTPHKDVGNQAFWRECATWKNILF